MLGVVFLGGFFLCKSAFCGGALAIFFCLVAQGKVVLWYLFGWNRLRNEYD